MRKEKTKNEILAGRLAGAVWGHLVGDATGVPYEFGPSIAPEAVEFRGHGTYNKPAGTWSDDGALMLALLDALLPAGDRPGEAGPPVFDLDRQAANALAWKDEGAFTPDGVVFDIGGTTAGALANLRRGVPPAKAGPASEHAGGNGSLMRILPLGLVFDDASPAALIRLATQASRMTHGHPRCQAACAVYTLIVAALLRGEEPGPATGERVRALRARVPRRGRVEPRGRPRGAADLPGAHRERLRPRRVLVGLGGVRHGVVL